MGAGDGWPTGSLGVCVCSRHAYTAAAAATAERRLLGGDPGSRGGGGNSGLKIVFFNPQRILCTLVLLRTFSQPA